MRSVLLSTMLGVAVVAAFSFLVSWPFAIASGMAVGFFAHRFRQETWPVAKKLWRFLKVNHRQIVGTALILGLAIMLFLLAVYGAGFVHRPNVNWAKVGDTVSASLAVIAGCIVTLALSYAVLWLFGCMSYICFEASILLAGSKKLAAKIDELEEDCRCNFWQWQFVVFGPTLPLTLALLVVMLLARLVILIYSKERAVIAFSVALGGWTFYAEKWASAEPVVCIGVGMLVGVLAGMVQYQLITKPLQSLAAKRTAT